MGDGFTWETQDRQRDIAAAKDAWQMAKQLISDETYKMVLLDELNIALRYDYLDTDEVIEARFGAISDIFARGGEQEFRQLEKVVARELASSAMFESTSSAPSRSSSSRHMRVYCAPARIEPMGLLI